MSEWELLYPELDNEYEMHVEREDYDNEIDYLHNKYDFVQAIYSIIYRLVKEDGKDFYDLSDDELGIYYDQLRKDLYSMERKYGADVAEADKTWDNIIVLAYHVAEKYPELSFLFSGERLSYMKINLMQILYLDIL